MKRRQMLKFGAAAVATAALPVGVLAQSMLPDSVRQKNKDFAGDKGPQLESALVQEFVRRAHFDEAYVRAALQEEPQLVYASWDWGGGDFETGLGAASHVGNRAIAEFLIVQGARPNLFSAAMLGQLAVVRALLAALPELINCKGPHGLSLIHHARKGGEPAAEVLAYLETFEDS